MGQDNNNVKQLLQNYLKGKSDSRQQKMLDQIDQLDNPQVQPTQPVIQKPAPTQGSLNDLGSLIARNNTEKMQGVMRGFDPDAQLNNPQPKGLSIPAISDEKWQEIQNKIGSYSAPRAQQEQSADGSRVENDIQNSLSPDDLMKLKFLQEKRRIGR